MKQETPTQTNQAQPQNSSQNAAGQKRKKTAQDYKKQAEQNKKRWMPFVRYMKKHGIKFKTARSGKFRVQYFRTDDLQELLKKNEQQIKNDNVLDNLIRCWQSEVIYFIRPQNIPKLKYPKQLQKSEGNSKSKFASFKFDTAEPKTWLFPTILIGIIAVVLFPLWPYFLKYSVFMVCLVLVTAIVSIIVLRLIVYLIFAIFGVSFWILPNFFADCTILQSFVPFYSSKKWQTGVFSIIGRLVALSIVGYYAYHLYLDSSWVYQNIEITKSSFEDLHGWGVSKIKGQKNFSQSALTNLDDIMNQTADVHVDQSVQLGNQQVNNQQNESQNQYNEEENIETKSVQTDAQQQEQKTIEVNENGGQSL